MKPSQHALDKQLVKKLNDVCLVRKTTEISCMFEGRDEADKRCELLAGTYDTCKTQAENLIRDGGSGFIRSMKKRLPGGNPGAATEKKTILGLMDHLKYDYQGSSKLRYSFEVISRLAYMKVPVDTDTYRHLRHLEWKMEFQLPEDLLNDWRSPWAVLNYDQDSFQRWWEKRLSLCTLKEPVDPEWKDMQALCSGLILLFECLGPSELSNNPRLGEDPRRLLDESKLLGNTLYDLLAYPECFPETSQLFGFTAAMVYVALKCIGSIRNSVNKQNKTFPNDGAPSEELHDNREILAYHGRQIKALCSIVKGLLDMGNRLFKEASKQRENIVVLQNVPNSSKSVSSIPFRKEENKRLVESAEDILGSCTLFNAEDIRRLGIREILLSAGGGRQIGFGSSSVVVERFPRNGSETYAVKEPTGLTKHNRDAIWNKFGREAQVWRHLEHDNIVPLRGFCVLSNDLPGLVMDVHRWNLKDFSREGSRTTREKLELLHGVGCGVSYLHSKSIAHGDLRACNILVKEDTLKKGFTALLADFGNAYFVNGGATHAEGETKFRTTADQVGNVGWLSPELLKRKEAQDEDAINLPIISIPGDIYSFGCVFLEAIYERDPYQACNSDEIKRERILEGVIPASLDETSTAYYEFLCSLWNPTPEQRPPMASIIDEVYNFLIKL